MSYSGKRKKLTFKKNLKLFLMADLKIALEFGGGAELLVGNQKVHDVTLPAKDEVWTIGGLLHWIKDSILKERPELFLQNGSVRPGILVLVNDADWELLDTVKYELKPNDRIVFISTLHGG